MLEGLQNSEKKLRELRENGLRRVRIDSRIKSRVLILSEKFLIPFSLMATCLMMKVLPYAENFLILYLSAIVPFTESATFAYTIVP